jgi:nucleotide-binding universal stress UspA family protein
MNTRKSSTQSAENHDKTEASKKSAEFGKILLPIDQYRPSNHALRLGVGLAQQLDASIVLMHLEITDQAKRKLVAVDEAGVQALDNEQLASLVQTLLGRSSARALDDTENVDEDVSLASHSAAEEISSSAEDTRADLIVMGMRHHSMPGKLLSGGVVDSVLNRAPCPVMVVS